MNNYIFLYTYRNNVIRHKTRNPPLLDEKKLILDNINFITRRFPPQLVRDIKIFDKNDTDTEPYNPAIRYIRQSPSLSAPPN